MLSFDQICFGLLRSQTPENIGSAARALKVMGFHPAAIIDPQCDPNHEKVAVLASHAADWARLSSIYHDLASWRSDVDIIIGFSARGSVDGPESFGLPELKTVLEEHQQSRIGLLFGPESSGLSNEDLSYCHYSCFIPTPSHTDYHSLNLAQAIQVVAYTCSQMMEVPSWQEQEQKNGEKQNSQGYSYDFLERWLDETLAKEAFKAFTQRTTLAQTQKKARIMLQRLVRSQEDLDFLCGFIKVYSKGM